MKAFFEPSKIALVGASEAPGHVGRTLLENLLTSAKTHTIYPVNAKKEQVLGLTAYPSVKALPEVPDLAIIAEYTAEGKRRNVGVGRIISRPNMETAEFAIVIADDFQRQGLGLKISDLLIGVAAEKGLKVLEGTVLSDNRPMLALATKLGFAIKGVSADETRIELRL